MAIAPMGPREPSSEALLVASLTLLLVLIVCYMCLVLHVRASSSAARRAAPCADRFWSPYMYRPNCSGRWLWKGGRCQGLTTGAMPSIEEGGMDFWRPDRQTCGGYLGVPP